MSTNAHSQNNNCIWCQLENTKVSQYIYKGASCTNAVHHGDGFIFNITNCF